MKKQGKSKSRRDFDDRLPLTLSTAFQDDLLSLLKTVDPATAFGDLGFKFKYQERVWLSKYTTLDKSTAQLRRDLAIEKWLKAEARNAVTNQRLLLDETTFTGGVTSQQIKGFARLVVRQVIGDSPQYDRIEGLFTNGASTRVARAPDAIALKFVGEAHVTSTAKRVFEDLVLSNSPAWTAEMLNGVFRLHTQESSMMFTVPKNSEIDRVACKEPEINMYLQRGAGIYIRQRLRSRGIDLRDQTQNQRLAQEGSIGRHLATLDLSSASDLISSQLVYDLLPLDWYLFLDSIRVKTVEIDGEVHELNMFSSMGNGFTFELESLLFYALSCAINRAYRIRGRISVYGDDIITPSAIAPAYPAIFSWFGFIVNSKKSFWTGSFRESCGMHYVNGFDVTPFFLKGPIVTLGDLIHQLNQLREWATRDGCDYWFPELHEFWQYWSTKVPRFLHGGKNLADKSCLVTPGKPQKRLTVPLRESPNPNVTGCLLQWLHAASTRDKDLLMVGRPGERPREWALGWLKSYDAHEPIVTSLTAFEGKTQITRNRIRNESLDQYYWFQELCCETLSSELAPNAALI